MQIYYVQTMDVTQNNSFMKDHSAVNAHYCQSAMEDAPTNELRICLKAQNIAYAHSIMQTMEKCYMTYCMTII